MDSYELASLEQGARAVLTELGLDWVRANIEQGIADGVHKEVVIGRSQHLDQPASLFDDQEGFQYAEPPAGKGGQRMIGNLRLGPADRMGLIIEALYRLTVELPAVQEDTVKRLAATGERDTVAEDLRFLPDEDDGTQPPPSLQAVTTPAAQDARRSAEAFLARLREVVRR